MTNSQRGVDAKLLQFCPHCHSKNIVKNGHPHRDKTQFYCKNCNKYFSDDSIRGYPPTNIPFPLIAYFLYFRRKIPEFSNMRKFRKFVNFWLNYLRFTGDEVSRQTVHHWIKNYEKYLDKVITFTESRDFVHSRIKELDKVRPPVVSIPYKHALKILERKYGKHTVVGLIKIDEEFFSELVEVVRKHGVFGWEFLEAGFRGVSKDHRSLSSG